MKSPSHVCIVTTSHVAKDDRIYYKQAISLARAGYRVSMIAPSDGAEELPGMTLLPMPPPRNRWDRYVWNCRRAFFLARRAKADVYHLHDPELLGVGLLLKMSGKKVIFDAHENYREKLLGMRLPAVLKFPAAWSWTLWRNLTARCFDHVVAADSHIRDLYGGKHCTVIGNYVPLEFGQIESRKPGDGVFRIVYAGGLDVSRGLLKLLDALDLLRLPAVEFHVAGRCSHPELIDRLKNHPRVVFHGLLPWEEMNQFLATGDLGTLLLQPVCGYDKVSGEGVIKLFEYMSLGLPVLYADFPKLRAFIEPIGAGYPVDPADPVKIAAAITHLYEQPELRQNMGENGQRAVRERYNWEREEQNLLAVYDHVLSGGRLTPESED
jgi:glycosyltransferase involved in cell wall biosynthesis